MKIIIEPQRDLGLVDCELGGWRGLLKDGETMFEKTSEDRAERFAVLVSESDSDTPILRDAFPTRAEAQSFNGIRKEDNR